MQIGDVSQRSGVSIRMLRHYDRVGLLIPSGRTGSGYREYGPADLRRLFEVEALRTLGLSLAEVTAALDDPGFDAANTVSRLASDTELRIAAERELLARLRGIEAATPQDWDDVLDVIGLITGLRSGAASERQTAALRWGTAPLPVLGQLVDAYLAEPDPSASGALRWAIVRAGEAAAPALAHCAQATDPDVRGRAVWALTSIDAPAASEALVGFADDPDAVIAGRALLALANREPERSGFEPDELCSRLVAMIAQGIDDVQAAEALGGLAARSADLGARAVELIGSRLAAAATAAAAVPDPAAATAEPAVPGPAARERLAQALGELPGDLVAPLLRDLSADPDESVSRTARYLLVRRTRGRRS